MLFLPFEIIEHIDSYLSKEDRHQLVFLNHQFYNVFIRLLYRTIIIQSKQQFKQLLCNFETTTTTNLPLGRCVYHIEILLDELSEQELKRLQTQCPVIQSIHVDWRIWNYLSSSNEMPRNYLSRPNLPPIAIDLISNYGSRSLSRLTLDLHQIDHINPTTILSLIPYLKSLSLMGINQTTNISLSLVELIHQSCPYLESLYLEGYQSDIQQQEYYQLFQSIYPIKKMKSFQLKCQYGADQFQYWLPFIGRKYPNLTQLEFHHAGDSKDMIEPWPTKVYSDLVKNCPGLNTLGWSNILPDFQFFQELDRLGHQQLKTLHITDTLPISCLLTSSLFESKNKILNNITQLSFGSLSGEVKPNELIQWIANACPRLTHLRLKEAHCKLTLPFKIDVILDHCKSLISLELEHIALRVNYKINKNNKHPLETLIMRQCSSFDKVFEYITKQCPKLKNVDLFAFTQRDRRYKVQIHLPNQHLEKVNLHCLRTESFDLERRVRFFCIKSQQDTKWYYLKDYTIKQQETVERIQADQGMELTKELVLLNENEVQLLTSLLNKPLAWSTVDEYIDSYLSSFPNSIVQYWKAKDIYDAGHVDFICKSVQKLYLNKMLLC